MLRFDAQEWLDHQDSSFFFDLWDVGGEGRATAMSCTGREGWNFSSCATPQAHGLGPVESQGTQTRTQRPTVKRSFARAMKRLQKTGFCIYRGNVHVRPPEVMTSPVVPKLQRPSAPRVKGPRLSCISWNGGGLTSEAYNELLVWLSIHQIDVCFIQGTRWAFDEPWESHGFALIPTPHQVGGHDGLLTIIRTQLCPPSAISHVIVLAGRIQHVRCHLAQITLDLVNCYQHPNIPARNRPDPIEARSQFWQAWEDLLMKLPFRNLLLVSGDFNCTMDAQKPRRGTDAQFPDQASFKAVIDRFALSSVRVHDSYPSYIGPAGHSNIDYIFARRPQLDRLSRQARCIRSFPINMHRAYPDHNPISCTVPLNWKAWRSQPALKCARLSWNTTQNMRQVWKDHTSQWTTFEAELDSSLRQATIMRTHPSSITDLVIRTCNDHFRKSTEPREVNWCLYSTRSLVALKWRHLHLARTTQLKTSLTNGVFRACYHMTQHAKLRHRLRKHCQDLRKQRVQKIIHDATQAAARHDARRLYMAIRTLTPKQPRRQIRFRTAGVAQTPQVELEALMTHFEAIFCGTSSDVPPLTPLDLPFTQEDLEHELRATQIDKAVAPGTMPPLIIKHFAPHLSHWLYRFLEVEWGHAQPTIPATWKNASLTLLAKRTVHSPNDLRPIALTCGLGKAVLGTLVKCAHSFMADSLVRFPLFAYTEKRGVLEALCFVFDHCHQVRQSRNLAKPSHWQKQAGHCIPLLTGGMMLSLDLSQAFDRLPRSMLYEGLLTCGCLSLAFGHFSTGCQILPLPQRSYI